MCDLLQAAFRVTLGGRRIAVDRTEIALTVDQGQAQRPVLRHARQRIVDRGIAVRMVFTHHVTGDAGRLHIFLVPVDPHLAHREQDAPVDRLQTVADIGKRTAHDNAHRVVEIRPLHFLHDGNRLDALRVLAAAGSVLLSQIRSRSLFGITAEFIADRPGKRQFRPCPPGGYKQPFGALERQADQELALDLRQNLPSRPGSHLNGT